MKNHSVLRCDLVPQEGTSLQKHHHELSLRSALCNPPEVLHPKTKPTEIANKQTNTLGVKGETPPTFMNENFLPRSNSPIPLPLQLNYIIANALL